MVQDALWSDKIIVGLGPWRMYHKWVQTWLWFRTQIKARSTIFELKQIAFQHTEVFHSNSNFLMVFWDIFILSFLLNCRQKKNWQTMSVPYMPITKVEANDFYTLRYSFQTPVPWAGEWTCLADVNFFGFGSSVTDTSSSDIQNFLSEICETQMCSI